MMTLPVRWRAESPFGATFRELERLLRDQEDTFLAAANPVPTLVSEQNADAHRVTVELPGFEQKDVQVELHQGVLTVSGQRSAPQPEGYRAVHRERAQLRFSRSVRLPDGIDEGKVLATMKNGVLSIELPKKPETKPRTIAIGAG
jgi:HSP20 family protein